jgi:hypothetical protein
VAVFVYLRFQDDMEDKMFIKDKMHRSLPEFIPMISGGKGEGGLGL